MALDPDLLKYLLGTGLQVGGSVFSGIQQGQNADANRALSGAQLQQNEAQFNANDDLARQKQGLAAQAMDPLAQQKSRQQQALLAAIMPNAQNAGATVPGGPRQGGVMGLIPQGGFDPSTLAFFSPEARAQAEGDFNKANAPFADPTDLTKVGYGAAGVDPTNAAEQTRSSFLTDQSNSRTAAHQALLQSLAQDQQSQDNSSDGFWHKFAKIAAIGGAGLATFLTAGAASPLLVGAIGAGSGALGAWGNGAGVGGTLAGAGIGGLAGGLGAKAAAPGASALTKGLNGAASAGMGNLTGGGGLPSQGIPQYGLGPTSPVPSYLKDPNYLKGLPGMGQPAPSPYGTPSQPAPWLKG